MQFDPRASARVEDRRQSARACHRPCWQSSGFQITVTSSFEYRWAMSSLARSSVTPACLAEAASEASVSRRLANFLESTPVTDAAPPAAFCHTDCGNDMPGSGHLQRRHGRAGLIELALAAVVLLVSIESPHAAGSQTPQANFWTCSPIAARRSRRPNVARSGSSRIAARSRDGRSTSRSRGGELRRAPPTAVFLLAGGPGGSSASVAGAAEGWARPLHSTMDIVAVDQRGTWYSNALHCAQETEARPATSFGSVFDEGWVRQCRALLERTADLRSTRRTPPPTIWMTCEPRSATSRSASTAPHTARGSRRPTCGATRSARGRLCSTPPCRSTPKSADLRRHGAAGVGSVFEQCATNAACRRAHPALRADFARLIDRFRAGPIAASVTPSGRTAVPVKMSLGDFGTLCVASCTRRA